jgi:hypothetical protein
MVSGIMPFYREIDFRLIFHRSLEAGFKFMENESFGGHKNDFYEALPILREKMKGKLLGKPVS